MGLASEWFRWVDPSRLVLYDNVRCGRSWNRTQRLAIANTAVAVLARGAVSKAGAATLQIARLGRRPLQRGRRCRLEADANTQHTQKSGCWAAGLQIAPQEKPDERNQAGREAEWERAESRQKSGRWKKAGSSERRRARRSGEAARSVMWPSLRPGRGDFP